MKRTFSMFTMLVFLAACGNAQESTNEAFSVDTAHVTAGVDWVQEGVQIFRNADAELESGWDVASNLNGFRPHDVATDGTFMYAVGQNWIPRWRIEKRRLSDGIREAAHIGDVTSEIAKAIAIADGHMYVVGTTINDELRIEKRFLADDMPIDAGFGTDGIVIGDVNYIPLDVAVDDQHIYVVGHVNFDWRVEKRNRTTGDLVGTFESGSVSTTLNEIAIDDTHMFLVGNGGASLNWRIEKRSLVDGALDKTFDGDGVIEGTSATSNCIAQAVAIAGDSIVVVGDNVFSNWFARKYDKNTGALVLDVWGDPSTFAATSLAVDGDYFYIGGSDEFQDARIEKRLLSNGALVNAFATGGVHTLNGVSVEVRALAVDGDSLYPVGVNNNAARLMRLFQSDGDTFARIGLPPLGAPFAGPNSKADDHDPEQLGGTKPFRVRLRMRATGGDVEPGNDTFKLQFAARDETHCRDVDDADYVDVNSSSGDIQFFDNVNAQDGDDARGSHVDPVLQSYEESNNFTTSRRIVDGHIALWDFSLTRLPGTTLTANTYCLRAVRDDGALLHDYEVYGQHVPDPHPILSATSLTCMSNAGVGGPPSGNAMHKVEIDLDRFPDAVCNDGTAAAMYVRAGTTEDKWVVFLQGGGGCNDAQGCGNRWCHVDTNFNSRNMSTKNLVFVDTIGPNGVLGNLPENPFMGWNTAYLVYCSSDTWSGTERGAQLQLSDPLGVGPDVDVTMHALGKRILASMFDTLQNRYQPIEYTVGAVTTMMPDLDLATEVVFAGSSAGGGGVTMNLDWVNERLSVNGTVVRGLLDASTQVDVSNPNISYANSTICTGTANVCSYDEHVDWMYRVQSDFRVGFMDESCLATAPDIRRCADGHYVSKNHLTTEFFVREDQQDSLHTTNFFGTNFEYDGPLLPLGSPPLAMVLTGVPANDTLVREIYSGLVKADMEQFETIDTDAVEAAAIDFTPGIFNPRCGVHEALAYNASAFGIVEDLDNNPATVADNHSMAYFWNNWVDPASVDPKTFYADISSPAICY